MKLDDTNYIHWKVQIRAAIKGLSLNFLIIENLSSLDSNKSPSSSDISVQEDELILLLILVIRSLLLTSLMVEEQMMVFEEAQPEVVMEVIEVEEMVLIEVQTRFFARFVPEKHIWPYNVIVDLIKHILVQIILKLAVQVAYLRSSINHSMVINNLQHLQTLNILTIISFKG
ncbi:hypothetical protein Syun_012854 [Stephania yunnanensis]|uniref:Uncharacterized protein n=1 Tax=Stephania yunnanensis TaxID=152371 RepID=A0AAP0PHY8_9MAGN